MQIRRPAVAGAFYPRSATEIKSFIERFLSGAKKRRCVGAVAPHAGYEFSGRTAVSVYESIENDFDAVVIVGLNHYGRGRIAASDGIWQTPLGSVKTDEELIEKMSERGITTDNSVHAMEHSIEVQVPFIQFFFPDVKIVPVSFSPALFDVKTCRQLGEAIFDSASEIGRKILVVASSDFTHYGDAYNYKPFAGTVSQILKKIRETDNKAIKAITDFAPERLIDMPGTICGYGCISALLYYSRKAGAEKAEVVDYRTSFETSRRADAIVSYCGILIQ